MVALFSRITIITIHADVLVNYPVSSLTSFNLTDAARLVSDTLCVYDICVCRKAR